MLPNKYLRGSNFLKLIGLKHFIHNNEKIKQKASLD